MYWIVLALSFAQAVPLPNAACASHAKPERGERFEKPALKGVELYGWKAEDGKCRYSLLWGTNRRKEEREVKASSCTLNDVTAVKASLTHFAKGETVVWLDSATPDDDACAPREVIDAVEAHCKSLGIVFLASKRAK